MYDTIIIGKGPAGISAAIYLKRSNKHVLVIGKDNGSLYDGVMIDNYYGFPGGISGTELIERGVKQATEFGIEVLQEEVIAIDKLDHFTVTTNKNTYEAKTVLLATGKPRTTLRIKGFQQYKGKGISFCVTCDGFFFRGKHLALIGYNDFMLHELKDMEFLTDKITIFTNGNPLTVPVEGYPVVEDKIIEITGDGEVAKSILTENGEYAIDGIFVALGSPGAVDFATRIGALVEGSNLVVNEDFQTNIEGLFAAGDTVGGVLQVAKAAADGMHAAIALKKILKK